jgi:excinuclease ABC subunit A
MTELLSVRGSREHNLKNVDLDLPKRKLIVMTGPSGSGKSSMAFDTIYAEGRRRYLDSLSVYARQFIGEMRRPDVDDLQGLAPTIAIEQKTAGHNPRSTVGTITEIFDFMRVLWSAVGERPSKDEGTRSSAASAYTPAEAAAELLELPEGTQVLILAPLARNRKGLFKDEIEQSRQAGFAKIRIDGVLQSLSDDIKLQKTKRHTIDLVIDRVIIRDRAADRLKKALQMAIKHGQNQALVEAQTPDNPNQTLSLDIHAFADSELLSPGGQHGLSPQCFSFNSPLGMCKACEGLGHTLELDPNRVIADPNSPLTNGAIAPWSWNGTNAERLVPDADLLRALYKHANINSASAWSALSDTQQRALLYGLGDERLDIEPATGRPYKLRFDGLLAHWLRLYQETWGTLHEFLAQFIRKQPCNACDASRLNPEARAILVGGRSIADINALTVTHAKTFFEKLKVRGARVKVAEEVVPEILRRLRFLCDVGLGYLQLNRSGPTLSGGESQRIRLASQLGSGLTGVLYVLDEPSIGLHPRDHRRLLATLEQLRDQGNTIIVVEHDADTMRSADHLVDFGPGAGKEGGHLMFSGQAAKITATNPPINSLTADYLSGRRQIETPKIRRPGNGLFITVRAPTENNLRGQDFHFPLGTFTCVTGVSGAGKSTLVNEILFPAALNATSRTHWAVGACAGVEGFLGDPAQRIHHIDRVIDIDQQPIGRTPRSNPATYTKVFDLIRTLYAALPDSQIYGYQPGRFSFNVKGGRCEACEGAGIRTLEMQFLADVYLPCEVCMGRRFNDATLRVRYRNKNIAEVLAFSIPEALAHFEAHPAICRTLQTMLDVGLGYLQLGQPSTTLSGGEAQRVKLSKELARPATGKTLYVLDEPSTGLHFEDIRHLLSVLQRLVDAGNTVVVIEHNLDIIRSADHLIDLGPEGGEAGGSLVAQGTPEAVAKVAASHTGRCLAEVLFA